MLAVGCGSKADEATSTGATPKDKRVFVTSTSLAGDFGGVAQADATCAAAAKDASLGGAWQAWVSDSKVNAIDRITASGPWMLLDGEEAFSDKLAMTSGPLVPVVIDEHGKRVDPNTTLTWTGTARDGTAYPQDDCSDWTTQSMGGASGAPAFDRPDHWSDYKETSCALALSFYCFEQ